MATGYLVTLGDGILGIGDVISGSQSTFTEDGAAIATGSWVWTGVWTGNGQTYSNIPDTGLYYLGTDGNTYFIPDTWTISSGTASVTQALDGTVSGTAGNDVIDANYTGDPGGEQTSGGDDLIEAGGGNDTVYAGLGDDTVEGGTGNDELRGETGDDSLSGDAGNDVIHGDASVSTGRAAFQWSAIDDPSGDGTTVDNGDAMTATANVDAGGTTITYTYTANPTGFPDGTGGTDTTPDYSTELNYVAGIDSGGLTVDATSALRIGGDLASNMAEVAFTDPVTNVSFRVNDIDSNGVFTDRITIRAYDDLGNQITVNLTGGSDLIMADTDGVAGNDQATSNGNAFDAADSEASILVNIPGPVARIEIVYTDTESTGDDGLVQITDIFFDEVADPTGNDTIDGGSGDDTVYGDGGNDVVAGGEDQDDLYGGDGQDTLYGGSGNDTLSGDSGDDSLFGETGNDALYGGADNDYVDGDGGNDTLFGGGGDDTIVLDSGNDTAFGGTGQDGIYASGGNNIVYGGANDDSIFMGTGNDVIDGGTGADDIYGGGANDQIVLTNNFGADTIDGGEDIGDTDVDVLDASAVTDDLTLDLTATNATDPENGTLSDGTDTATFDNIETVILGSGDDSVTGSSGGDTITTGTGADTIDAGAGDDTLNLGAGSPDGDADLLVFSDNDGNDTVTNFDAPTDNGDGTFAGIDMLDVSGLNDLGGQPVNTNDTTVTDDGSGNAVLTFPGGESITLIGISPVDADNPFYLNAIGIPLPDGTVSGTLGDDLINGSYDGDPDGDFVDNNDAILPGDTGNDDLIEAGTGNDTVFAGDGDDSILAGTGSDTVYGGDGNDSIDGEGGPDTLFGGDGNDEISGSGSIMGGDGDDFIMTDPGASSSVDGGAGNDVIIDQGGIGTNDTLVGGSGNDLVLGSEGNDSIYGGTGNDDLEGGDGDDIFYVDPDYDTDNVGGGENGETNGDTLDATILTTDQTVVFSGDEAGALSDNANTGDPATDDIVNFRDIEHILLGSGDDSIDTATFAASINAGEGDDTFALNDGFGAADLDGGEGGETTGDLIDGAALTDAVTVTFSADEDGTITDGTSTLDFANIERINTGSGDDTITGSAGSESIDAGAGNDTILGGAGADDLSGGDGNDTIDGGTGTDSIYGGEGDDTINLTGTFGDDQIIAGEGGETNGDTLDGSTLTQNVTVTMFGPEAGTFADTTSSASFSDVEQVITGSGDDTVIGGSGADTVSTGAGDDTITFSDGDSMSGGAGDDIFTLTDQAGTDTITIDGGAGDESIGGGDTLELGGLADLASVLASAVDDGTGSFSGSILLDDGTTLNYSEIENIICFTPGTMIATPRGARDIADLAVGDMVVTRDHGLQPIRWIQRRTVPALDRFAPVRIRPGVMTGQETDLLVSPQHRMLFQGYRAELLFGESEVLVAAKHLIDGIDVTQEIGGDVTYIHMMFDEHEIVFAEGAATESFHPGEVGLTAVQDSAREELFDLFPALRSNIGGYGQTARRCLKRREAELLRI